LGAAALMFDSLSEATAIVQVSLNDGRGSGKVRARRNAEGSVRVQFDALHQGLHVFGLHARRIELRQPHLAIAEGHSHGILQAHACLLRRSGLGIAQGLDIGWVHPTHQTLDLIQRNALLAQAQGGIDEAMGRCPISIEFEIEFRAVQGKILAEVGQYALSADPVSPSKQFKPTPRRFQCLRISGKTACR
jgi:hypothetical protein